MLHLVKLDIGQGHAIEGRAFPLFSEETILSMQDVYPKPKNWCNFGLTPPFQSQCAAPDR